MEEKKIFNSFETDFFINVLSRLYPKEILIYSNESELKKVKEKIGKINSEREQLSVLVSDLDKCLSIVDKIDDDDLLKEILKLLLVMLKYKLKDMIHILKPDSLLKRKYELQKEIECDKVVRDILDSVFKLIV